MRLFRGGRDFLSCFLFIFRIIYRIVYRRSFGSVFVRFRYVCCFGWKRISGFFGVCGVGEGCGRSGV